MTKSLSRRVCRGLSAAAAGCLVLLLAVAGSEAFRIDAGRLLNLAETRYGGTGRENLAAWLEMLTRLPDQPLAARLDRINRFVNQRILYADDLAAWGVKDYWATPLESLGRGLGDCEDSAFAKYVSLLIAGIPDDQLRLTYVRAKVDGRSQAHMVVSYYPTPDREPLIIDSLTAEILPASLRGDLYPVFSFNTSALWVGGANSPAAAATARLSHWRSVLDRMREEGWK